jgi:hypothetical protein
MDTTKRASWWRRSYRRVYQHRSSGKRASEWSPPGPFFDAFLLVLLVFFAVAYFV